MAFKFIRIRGNLALGFRLLGVPKTSRYVINGPYI